MSEKNRQVALTVTVAAKLRTSNVAGPEEGGGGGGGARGGGREGSLILCAIILGGALSVH